MENLKGKFIIELNNKYTWRGIPTLPIFLFSELIKNNLIPYP